jgi:hypothetical protein
LAQAVLVNMECSEMQVSINVFLESNDAGTPSRGSGRLRQ